MNDAEIMSNVMHQIRVNQAAIYLLAKEVGVDPAKLLDDAAWGVNQLLKEGGFDE